MLGYGARVVTSPDSLLAIGLAASLSVITAAPSASHCCTQCWRKGQRHACCSQPCYYQLCRRSLPISGAIQHLYSALQPTPPPCTPTTSSDSKLVGSSALKSPHGWPTQLSYNTPCCLSMPLHKVGQPTTSSWRHTSAVSPNTWLKSRGWPRAVVRASRAPHCLALMKAAGLPFSTLLIQNLALEYSSVANPPHLVIRTHLNLLS